MKPGMIEIITPEGVVLEYETAGIGARAVALFIDTIFMALINVLIAIPLIVSYFSTGEEDIYLIFAVLITAFFSLAYYMLFELLLKGQTPGKRLTRIRVVKINGSPATAGAIIMRNLLRLIDQLPTFYLIGMITAFINPQERRIGDLVAGTMVVKEFTQAKTYAPTNSPSRDVSLTPHEILTLQSFFQREGELANDRRVQLQTEYLDYFRTKYDVYPMEGEQATCFLRSLLVTKESAKAPEPGSML